MLKSMTGYGRAEEIVGGKDITVEIKSVNHRFFEFNARTPRSYGYIEEPVKSLLQSMVSRGKVEVNITLFNVDTPNEEITVNIELARDYLNALRTAAHALGVEDDLKMSNLAAFSDIFAIRKKQEDEDAVVAEVLTVTEKAAKSFIQMRETEGEKLKADLLQKLASIEASVSEIESRAAVLGEDYRARLFQKLSDILHDTQIDEQRILTEAAIFAEKVAVDEETVRLRSHIAQFRQLLDSDVPIGRKLDFLIQEFNREANTIGSKIQNVEITRIVVEIKSDIEKIREQIQNIE